MKIIKVFVLILISSKVSADCNISSDLMKKRGYYRQIVNNRGKLNFIFDYEFLQENSLGNTSNNFLNFLKNPEIDFGDQIKLIEVYKLKKKFQTKFSSNFGSDSTSLLEYSKVNFKVNLDFLKDKKCAKNVKPIGWQISSENSFCVAMAACHVTKFKKANSFVVKKRIIFLVDENHNLSAINSYLPTKGVNFNGKHFHSIYFPSNDFCLCDFLDSYFNDCTFDWKFHNLLALILIFVIVSYFSIETYLCFIGQRTFFRSNQVHPMT